MKYIKGLMIIIFLILTYYFLSGGTRKMIYKATDFDVTNTLTVSINEKYDDIKKELDQLAKHGVSDLKISSGLIYREEGNIFADDVRKQDKWIQSWENKGDWIVYPIIYNGKIFDNSIISLPVLFGIVKPFTHKFHSLFISRLKPGGEIPEHNDGDDSKSNIDKKRLTYHYNIDSPPGSYINVGDKHIEQKDKGTLVFDAAFNHHVKNSSKFPRTIICGKFYK